MKDILTQYSDLVEEIKDLRIRIKKKEDKLVKLDNEGVVTDIVCCGKKGNKSLGNVKITGFPLQDYNRVKTDLYMSKLKLQHQEEKCLSLIHQVEDYINNIQDSRMRRIIRYKFMDDMTWPQVAANMGGKSTVDSIRKEFERFIHNSKSLSDLSTLSV